MRIATTAIQLKGFVSADTASQFEGFLSPGRYVVLEELNHFPDEDTDYARIEAPTLGENDTWICARWKDQRYAILTDVDFESTRPAAPRSDAIPESIVVAELAAFLDFRYDRDRARYPKVLPDCILPTSPPATNNCCTFVEGLIVAAWQQAHPAFKWTVARHHQMMIMSNDDFFSPTTALVDAGIADAIADVNAPPPPWTVVQGWRFQWRGGHTFIVVDHDPGSDHVLTLESNSAFRLDGVGMRAIGNLRDFGGEPPDLWWERDDLWTWQRICSTYRFRSLAALKVSNPAWSKRH